MVYIILGILIVGGFFFYLVNRKKTLSHQQQGRINQENNPYSDLRKMALDTTATEQLGSIASGDKKELYGVVIDWDIGDGIVTLVSFMTGDASLYLSSGGGFIGGGGQENIAKASSNLIEKAKHYLDRASLAEATPLPGKGELTFYFLTNKGKFKATEKMQNIQKERSEWLGLFEEASKVITEIRIASEKEKLLDA